MRWSGRLAWLLRDKGLKLVELGGVELDLVRSRFDDFLDQSRTARQKRLAGPSSNSSNAHASRRCG